MAATAESIEAFGAPETAGTIVRVMIVADVGMLADALRAGLERDGDIEVVSSVSSVAGAVKAARIIRPDLVLMDFQLPDGEAPSAIPLLTRRPSSAQVIVLSASADYRSLTQALDAGAAGYLSKDQRLDELIAAIHAVMAGQMVVAPTLLPVLLRSGAPGTPGRRLSRREADVLQLMAGGASNPDIATRLHLSEHTVRNHVQHIFARLGAHSKLEAVAIGLRRGLISPPSRN
jgi:DNA-binding NarL/FixJ family response regulator